MTVQLGRTLELSVADQVDWELEVEVEGDQIELEWSTSRPVTAGAAQEASEDDNSEEDASEEVASRPVSGAGDAEEPGSGGDVAEGDAETGEPHEDPAESGGTETVEAATERTPASRGRRRTTAGSGKPAFNGVDRSGYGCVGRPGRQLPTGAITVVLSKADERPV